MSRAENESSKKTHIAMVCPCCGGEVTHQRYGFDMIVVAPLRRTTWYVCDQCEADLSGTDETVRRATERAFEAYLDGCDHAPTA